MNRRSTAIRFFAALLVMRGVLFISNFSADAAPATVPSTQPAVSMSVSPTGSISLFLGGRLVADGTWELQYSPADPVAADEVILGSVTSRSATVDSPTHAIIVHQYAKALARYDLS